MAVPLLAITGGSHCFDVQFHPSENVLVTTNIEGEVELYRFWEQEVVKTHREEAALDSDYEVVEDDIEQEDDGAKAQQAEATDDQPPSGDAAGVLSGDGGSQGPESRDLRDDGAYGWERVAVMKCHEDSCRTARFLESGKGKKSRATRFVTASADNSATVWDVVAQKRLSKHPLTAGGNCVLPIDPYCFAVGDDGGAISIFDVRQGSEKPTRKYEENEEFISDMIMGPDEKSLCATSGDGTLAVYDVRRKPKLIAMSDFQEDEFSCLVLMKSGQKVICGSQKGVLCVFTWGDFGDQKDRIPGHPMSVDAIVKLNEEVLLTGASDGKVRLVTAYHEELGNRIVAEVAQHSSWPIERISLSPEGDFFATASHSQPAVKLWRTEDARRMLGADPTTELANAVASTSSASALQNQQEGNSNKDDDASEESSEPASKRRRKGKKGMVKKKLATSQQLFFTALS